MKSSFTSACALALVALALNGCSSGAQKLASVDENSGGLWSIVVSSPAFHDAHPIPERFTTRGQNISPPINWARVPADTKEIVVIAEDPVDGWNSCFVHWLVYNIPAEVGGLHEDASDAEGVVEGKNSLGKTGYTGPNPPAGQVHTYYFQVYALDANLNLRPNLDANQVIAAMRGHVLAKGQITATCKR